MNEQMKLAIAELELAKVYAALCSVQQNFSDSIEMQKELSKIADEVDKMRRKIGVKIG